MIRAACLGVPGTPGSFPDPAIRAASALVGKRRRLELLPLAWFMCASLSAYAASSGRHPARAAASAAATASVVHDFATLATAAPKPCPADEATLAIDGWNARGAACGWQNRLRMQQWTAPATTGDTGCTGVAARWWAALFARWDSVDRDTAWNTGWPAQSLHLAAPGQERLAVIEHMADGSWLATEWRWTPSLRTATRHWQQRRWNLLAAAAASRRQQPNAALVAADAAALFHAWQKSRGSGAADIGPDGWHWESDGLCMRMETVGISQAQLHLPYSREESRLEQRAAMQLRLARSHPKARWLTPFSILPAASAAAATGAATEATTTSADPHGGATYEALWLEDDAVRGQLWIPRKTGNAIHRARISVRLPAPVRKEDDPRVLRIATVIKRRLAGLANEMAADHGR